MTTAARTLLDLAASEPALDLEALIAGALKRGLAKKRELNRLIVRHRGRPGTPRLAALLDTEPALTRSKAERRLLALIRRAQLPAPECNVLLESRYEVDLLWRSERVIVEVDGYAFHSDRAAFERDRVRDAELQAMGFVVVRITWRAIVGEPEAVVARIARALAAGVRRASGYQ